MQSPTLSLLIAAHHEGRIAHKTMLSVERALRPLIAKEISFEVLVTVDNGDADTLEYFRNYTALPIQLHVISEGDLSASRNYAVAHSTGAYIAVLDADDLVSDNWFIAGIEQLQHADTPQVLHTNFSVNFGTQDVIWEKFDSRSKEEDAIILTWANRWDSAIIAPREVFERFPYQPNKRGFGSEDWQFNSDTLAADIPHKVAPQTVLFVRRKDVSEMTIQAADSRSVHYTNLLSIDFLKTIDVTPYENAAELSGHLLNPITLLRKAKHIGVETVRFAHVQAKQVPLYHDLVQPLVEHRKQRRHARTDTRFPSWFMEAWRTAHIIDKSIYPSRQLIREIPVYHSEMYELGVAFQKIMSHFASPVDYIMILPALRPGGAEVVMLNFLRALKIIHPEWNLAIVTTERNKNIWRGRLPDGVAFVDFGNITDPFSDQHTMMLLARLIVQSKATHIHLAQSLLGFKFASRYQSFLSNYTVFSFAFCEDTSDEGLIAGHIHTGIPITYPAITKIFSDHHAIIDELVTEYALDRHKFATLYQPVDVPMIPSHSVHAPLRILWASRITKQKRPDILKAIAQQLDPTKAHIDVYGLFEHGYDHRYLANIPSLTYKGTFSDVEQLNADSYDVFLYTSENDGIPNILLEMICKGLLVVAPKIGGIPELISDETGILIETNTDITAYVTAINELVRDYNEVYRPRIDAAQKLVQQRHTFNHLIEEVKEDL